MKKIYLFASVALFSFGLKAQNAIPTPTKLAPVKTGQMQFDMSKARVNQKDVNSRATTVWLNYASSIDQLNGGGQGMSGPAVLNANYLFPDSLGYGEFGTGNFSSIWIHHVADVLDVKSDVFDIIDGINWGTTDAFSLDSMSLIYGYTRNHTNTNIVDTLIVTLWHNNTAANMPGSGFIGATAANYLTDTVSFKSLKYLQTTNVPDATGKYVFKILLTEADTANFYFREKAFKVPTPFQVPAGKLMAADVMFKPGYTYALGDQIDYVANAFFFASYEEQGTGTFPTYWDCNYQSVTCDYNTSYILPQDVRYNNAAGWNNRFIPAYAYGVGYRYEHHLISYMVSNPPTIPSSIIEDDASAFVLSQNQPNPFTDKTNINYKLKNAANTISIEVFDVRGVRIYQNNLGSQKAGNYSVEINNTDFASGIYFYTLTVDGAKVTKKMTVK